MWTKLNVALLVAGSLVVSPAAAASREAQAILMAQNTATPERPPGRDVLVAGADAIVEGKSPAAISIDVGKEALPARPKLELSLAPATVVPNERYLIVVSVKSGDGAAKRVGTVSFFPPIAGAAQIFYFDAAPIIAEMKASGTSRIDLSIALRPVEPSKALTTSAVRVVGARLVGA